MEKITAKVLEVKHPRPEIDEKERQGGKNRQWYVLSVMYEGRSLKATGECGHRPNVNSVYDLTGDWTVWNGTAQFKFKVMEERIPDNPKGLLFYACQLTPGFGDATAEAIWNALGENWQDIEAGDVPRITETKIAALMQTLQDLERRGREAPTIIYLMQHSCTRKMAEAAWAKWLLDTISVVNANCYRLADLPNYGFRTIDNGIRQTFGIEDGDPRRIDAAIRYCFDETTAGGDTVVSWPDYWNAIRELLANVPDDLIYARIAEAFRSGDFILFDSTSEFTSARLYEYETAIWEYVRRQA